MTAVTAWKMTVQAPLSLSVLKTKHKLVSHFRDDRIQLTLRSGENVEADCETLEDTHSHVTKPSECIYQGRCC